VCFAINPRRVKPASKPTTPPTISPTGIPQQDETSHLPCSNFNYGFNPSVFRKPYCVTGLKQVVQGGLGWGTDYSAKTHERKMSIKNSLFTDRIKHRSHYFFCGHFKS